MYSALRPGSSDHSYVTRYTYRCICEDSFRAHSWNFSTIAFSSLGGGLLPASLEEVYKARKKIRAPQGVASPELCTTLSYGGGAAPVVEFRTSCMTSFFVVDLIIHVQR